MCNSYKIKSLLHKLPLDRAPGKDGIFAEHIFMLIQVCVTTEVFCSMCVECMEKFHRIACKLSMHSFSCPLFL